MKDLDDALVAAHAAGDSEALIMLYQQAAVATPDPNAMAFFLTHAYIFALESAHPDAPALRAELISLGREVPLGPDLPPKR